MDCKLSGQLSSWIQKIYSFLSTVQIFNFSIIVGEVEPKHSGTHMVIIGVSVLLVV